jgi:hypothetical protein
MRRRSKAGGEPAKTRRHKAAALKRPNTPKVRGRGTRALDQDTEIARVIRERDQALEQLSEAWSSRPRPPKFCASSAHRPVSWSQCSRRFWRAPCASVRPNSACLCCIIVVTARSTRASWSARRRPSSRPCCTSHLRRRLEILSTACCGQRKQCMSSTRRRKKLNRPLSIGWRSVTYQRAYG